jgi:hypothetical protein
VPPHPGGVGGPARRRRTGVVVGAVVGAFVLAVGVIGYLGNRGDTKDSGNTAASGGKASGAQSTGRARAGSTSKPSAPKPTVYKNFNLTDGFHLVFSDEPLVPRESNYDDLYFGCDMINGCNFGSYNTKLVLLDQGVKGSLDACKQDTRYLPQEVALSRFSKGRQLCAITEDGIVALVTFQGQSSSTSASRYVTLDVSIWRDAVPPTDN